MLQRHVDGGGITGAVFAFSRRGSVGHHGAVGFADPLAKTPIREDALFQTYSSTKVVTATALLMAMEEGLLRLEDPVSRYFPEFKNAKVAVRRGPAAPFAPRKPGEPPPPYDLTPAQRDITVKDLATHTAGLMTSDPQRVGMQPPRRAQGQSLSCYARDVGPTPLDFQPGSRWSYSPLVGADVLAGLVEHVSAQPFDQFIQERIFAPLAMSDTGFYAPASRQGRLLPVFYRKDDRWARVEPRYTTEAAVLAGTEQPQGSMGLVSTCADLLKLQQMLVDHGRAPDGRPLLGARTVALMGTNLVGDLYRGEGAYLKPMYGHGFGVLVQVLIDPVAGAADSARSPGAFGWAGYLGTMNWTDPAEQIAGVIMLQQNNREVHVDYERAIRQAIAD